MRRIYVVGGNAHYANWMQGKETIKMEKADLVVFTGGPDISPSIYGCQKHPFTDSYTPLRDDYEIRMFNKALKLNKKVIGICRGAQLLCALAGGILIQDSKHPSLHFIETSDGKKIIVTSSHHQRQYPFPYKDRKPNFELLGWSKDLSPYSEGQSLKEKLIGQPEVEIARYPDINALAIQSHPEWAYPTSKPWQADFISHVRSLLDKHMES